MPSEESKNAVNAICGMFKAMTGQKMKTLDNLKKGHNHNLRQKSFNLTPSMVFIGVSLNFGILEQSGI